RIARRAEQLGLRERRQSELRRVRLAEDESARPAVASDDLGVVRRDEVVEDSAAVPDRSTGVPGQEVLEQERDSSKRSGAQRAVGCVERIVVELVDDGVDLWVERFDPLDG